MASAGYRRVPLLIATVALVVSVAGGLWYYLHSAPTTDNAQRSLPPPADPRLAYRGPFRNIDPGVRYVGSTACVPCHASIAESYSKHPMARSLLPIAGVAAAQVYDQAHNNPFMNDEFKSRFRIDRDGDRVWHRQARLDSAGNTVFARDMEVGYTIGSGARGYSYLIERDGYLFQSPISWFAQKDQWDLSPNFIREMLGGRPVFAACVFCHANQARPVDGTMNRYQQPIFVGHGIGCERCHGPGEKHVEGPGYAPETKTNYTIVNPRKLPHAEREAVCQQCHLASEGSVLPRGRRLYDFRPGLPLDSCLSVFVEADEAKTHNAVNHVEQMYQCRCFAKSAGEHKLGCISCHNPHEHIGPERRVPYYRNRCLACHTDGASAPGKAGCAMPRAARLKDNAEDSCIACHMPRYAAADIPHNASTNHHIQRRPAKQEPAEPPSRAALVHFHKGKVDNGSADLRRDLGIALCRMTVKRELPRRTLERAIVLLRHAVSDFPDDLDAREELGKALFYGERAKEALAAFETVLAKDANREISLAHAALITQGQGKDELALGYWQKAVDMNPWAMEYVSNYTLLLAGKGDWDRVRESSRRWLRLDPANIDARKLQIECMMRAGKSAEARAEMGTIEALNPPNLPEVRAWFAQRIKDTSR